MEQHICALVLHGLESTNDLSELLACFGVLHCSFEHHLHCPNGFGADNYSSNLRRIFERRPGVAAIAQKLIFSHEHVVKMHIAQFPSGIKGRAGSDSKPFRSARDCDNGEVATIANYEKDDVSGISVEHKGLATRELPGAVGLLQCDLNIFRVPTC